MEAAETWKVKNDEFEGFPKLRMAFLKVLEKGLQSLGGLYSGPLMLEKSPHTQQVLMYQNLRAPSSLNSRLGLGFSVQGLGATGKTN